MKYHCAIRRIDKCKNKNCSGEFEKFKLLPDCFTFFSGYTVKEYKEDKVKNISFPDNGYVYNKSK